MLTNTKNQELLLVPLCRKPTTNACSTLLVYGTYMDFNSGMHMQL